MRFPLWFDVIPGDSCHLALWLSVWTFTALRFNNVVASRGSKALMLLAVRGAMRHDAREVASFAFHTTNCNKLPPERLSQWGEAPPLLFTVLRGCSLLGGIHPRR